MLFDRNRFWHCLCLHLGLGDLSECPHSRAGDVNAVGVAACSAGDMGLHSKKHEK